MDFDYFYGRDAESFRFIRLPIVLIEDETFKSLSIDAKVLYSMYLSRSTLSYKNNWVDETWKGNHRYLSDYRNQMTHRNSPNVTGVLGQEFNMKTPPIYLIKRTSEDYSYIINKLASLTEKIESELVKSKILCKSS